MGSGPRILAVLAEDAFARRGDYPSLLFEGVWHRSAELFAGATEPLMRDAIQLGVLQHRVIVRLGQQRSRKALAQLVRVRSLQGGAGASELRRFRL